MINLGKDILSLTDFKRNSAGLMKRLSRKGRPLVLTVNGKAEAIVQDVESYQRMLEAVEHIEAIEGIQRGLDSFAAGKGIPLQRSERRMRRKHGIPR